MSIENPKTATELRLFKEKVIRDYKLTHETKRNNSGLNFVLRRVRSILPLNIALGVIASVFLVVYVGWSYFFQLMLSGIIWITLISTVIGSIVKDR